jgi:hypothetical protein
MDAGYAGAFQFAFQRQIEVGRIDANEDRGRVCRSCVAKPAESPGFCSGCPALQRNRAPKALASETRIGAQRLHFGAGDADKLKIGLGMLERADQQAAEQIARRFARDNANLKRRFRHVAAMLSE